MIICIYLDITRIPALFHGRPGAATGRAEAMPARMDSAHLLPQDRVTA